MRGKRVVVVGAGKSALDCTTVAATHGASCTLVFRTPPWMMPRYFFKRIRMDRLFVTRLAEQLFPTYHRPTRIERLWHRTAGPLLRLWWSAQTWLIPRLSDMPADMVPDKPLPTGLENSGVGTEFYQVVKQRGMRTKRAQVTAFSGPDTIQLDTDEQINADVIIFATGWHQDLSLLDTELRRMVQPDGRFHLYRHILPPQLPHLGFIGYASSTACPFISGVAAHWLSACFQGTLTLPSGSEMEQEITRVLHWLAEVFPARPDGYFIGPYISHYSDELLHDLGLRTRRRRNILAEYLSPFWPERYRDIAEERQHVHPV